MTARPLVALVLIVALAGPGLRASTPGTLASRDGDNTISFRWSHDAKRVEAAGSSRIIVAGAQVEILTSLRDREGKIAMRGVLRNISDDDLLRVKGRLVHKVWSHWGKLLRKLPSRSLDVILAPGDAVRARFSYRLPSGRYSVRTDFVARRHPL